MKRAGIKVFTVFVIAVIAFWIGLFVEFDGKADEEIIQPIVRIENLLVLQYEGQSYVVGFVDTLTNQPQILNSEIISFLLSQAHDKGIQEAAKYIGFTGPQTVQLRERILDEP